MPSSNTNNDNKDAVLARYHQQQVQELFDDYADAFDVSLGRLCYQVPQLLHRQWRQHYDAAAAAAAAASLSATNTTTIATTSTTRSKIVAKCLDLGCGTGLSGAAFCADVAYLEGVDLSSPMLRQAARKQVYQRLSHGTLLARLQAAEVASFDLIICVDVFMYVLDLAIVLKHVHRVLSADGWLVFSTEVLLEEEDTGAADGSHTNHAVDFVRRESERFAHKRQYVLDVAAAESLSPSSSCSSSSFLKPVDVQRVTLRMDEGKPVLGDLFVFQKSKKERE